VLESAEVAGRQLSITVDERNPLAVLSVTDGSSETVVARESL